MTKSMMLKNQWASVEIKVHYCLRKSSIKSLSVSYTVIRIYHITLTMKIRITVDV